MKYLSNIFYYITTICGIILTILSAYCMTINSTFFFFFVMFLVGTIINIIGLYGSKK